MRRLAPLAACFLITACAGTVTVSPPTPAPEGWTPLAVETRTVGLGVPGGVRLASGVRFAGGLQIVAPSGDRTHGLSDLHIEGDELLAVSDAGDLFHARLVFDRSGRPAALEGLRVRPLTGEDGRPFPTKGDGDAESLTVLDSGELLVGFEQTPRLWSYGLAGTPDAPRPLPVPPVPPGNDGMEALAAAPGGWRVAAEGGGVWDCDRRACRGVVQAPEAPIPVSDWRTTGLTRDPGGHGWFVVQRLYREPIDARGRIRRMDAAGELGPVLVELSLPSTTDNFEGIAAVPTAGGVRLYILSDDNGDARQRTLLLAFEVAGGSRF